MSVETNKKSFSPEATADLAGPETFSHVFSVPALDDSSLLTSGLVTYPNQAMEVFVPRLATTVSNPPTPISFPKPETALEETTLTSAVEGRLLDGSVVDFSGRTESMRTEVTPKMITPLEEKKPAELLFSSQLLPLDKPRAISLEPTTPMGVRRALSDVIKIVDKTSQELERCTCEVEEKMTAKDEQSVKEKAHAIQILNNLSLALSTTGESLRKIEKSPNHVSDVDIRETKVLEDALAEVRAYFSTQVPELGLNCFADLKETPSVGENFLSSVSAMADIDSKTVGIILGVLGALGLGSLAAYMMLRKDDKPSEYETLGNKDEDGRRSGNSASPVKVKALEETWIDECIKDHLIPLLTNRISALGTEIRTAEASLDVRQPTESKRKQTNGKIQRCRNDISTLKTQLEQLKTETDRRKTIRAEIEKLVTTEIHMDHRVINNAGSVRYHYIPNFVFAQAFGSFLQMLGIPSGQSVEAFKTKILSLRVSAHNEIPFRSEGIGAAKLNPAERMYVPQAYFGFYWIPNDSGTFPIQYLSTSGAAPCLVLTFFAGNAQGKLSAIAHLDGTHNSKKKLKTYVRDIFEWMKTLFKSMPTIQANIMVSAENRITPCVLDSSFNLSPREYVENLYDTLPYTLQLLSSLDDSNPAKPWVLYLSSEKDETDSVMIKYVTVRENNERIEGVIKPADLPEVSLPDSDDLSQFEAIKSGLLTCAIGKGDIFETRDCDLTEEVRQSLNEQANESSVELNLQIYKSTLKSIDVAIQVTNGEFFTYKEDLDPNALRTRADSAPTSIFQFDDQQAIIRAAAKKPTEPEAPPSFGEAMQLKDHGTLFYLKPRGSVCQIDPHFFMLRLKWFGCGDFNADTFYGIDRQYTPTFDRSCALADQLPVQQAEAQAFESKLGSDAFKAFFGI